MIGWKRKGREPASAAIAVVMIHFVVSVLHGIAHNQLSVILSGAQQLFVGVFVVALPLGAAYLLWKGDRRNGGALLAASMAGAFIFGVYFHFVLPGSDHVGHALTPAGWSPLFDETAFELAVLEALGVSLGLRLLIKSSLPNTGVASSGTPKSPDWAKFTVPRSLEKLLAFGTKDCSTTSQELRGSQ